MADSLDPTFEIDSEGIIPLQEYALRSKKTFEEVLVRASAGVVRRVMGITPPGNDPGRDGNLTLADRQRGEAAINRDLLRIFTPVALKHKRKEQYPDLKPIWLRNFKYKQMGKPMKIDKARGFYHVDENKFKLLYVELSSHVGRMAAGWRPAAEALGVASPAWVARHSSPGHFDVIRDEQGITIVATNSSIFPQLMAEMQRRIPYAMQYQANAMAREMAYLTRRDAALAGLAA